METLIEEEGRDELDACGVAHLVTGTGKESVCDKGCVCVCVLGAWEVVGRGRNGML